MNRIISLVPSITETMVEFDAPPIARTRFCVEPRGKVEKIPTVGGTKTPVIERIIEMTPDLVIANQEENRKEDVEALIRAKVPVWVTYPVTIEEVVPYIRELGAVTQRPIEATWVIEKIDTALAKAKERSALHTYKTIALIWKDPWMAIGGRTYSNSLIQAAGGVNPFCEPKDRYPRVTEEEIVAENPDVLLLPSEPFPFGREHVAFWSERLPSARIALFGGEDLTWFGPRLPRALTELARLLSSY